jgi:hypothetical protein
MCLRHITAAPQAAVTSIVNVVWAHVGIQTRQHRGNPISLREGSLGPWVRDADNHASFHE